MNKFKQIAAAAVLGFGVVANAQAVPIAADVLFIVDESGSMNTEHGWLGSMVTSLETGLMDAGVGDGGTANNYGLVGFGASDFTAGHSVAGHKHSVGGADWGTAADLSTATGGLVLTGGTEDGWQAIQFALDNYAFRGGDVALNVVLVTDEDRDNTSGDTYASVLSSLTSAGAILNSVVNCNHTADSMGAIGVDSDGVGYLADGSGGYTSAAGATSCVDSLFNTTRSDYVDMAWATGGAAWDLNILRNGGNDAVSFTNAFVDVKVEEIVTHDVPEPGGLALLGLGLVGVGFAKKRSLQKLVA